MNEALAKWSQQTVTWRAAAGRPVMELRGRALAAELAAVLRELSGLAATVCAKGKSSIRPSRRRRAPCGRTWVTSSARTPRRTARSCKAPAARGHHARYGGQTKEQEQIVEWHSSAPTAGARWEGPRRARRKLPAASCALRRLLQAFVGAEHWCSGGWTPRRGWSRLVSIRSGSIVHAWAWVGRGRAR